MQHESLTDLVQEHLKLAWGAATGRSAHTVHGGRENSLRQTLIALRSGSELQEHDNPGDATVQVLHGRVVLVSGEDRIEAVAGDHVIIPAARHSLEAPEDAVVLLTVALAP